MTIVNRLVNYLIKKIKIIFGKLIDIIRRTYYKNIYGMKIFSSFVRYLILLIVVIYVFSFLKFDYLRIIVDNFNVALLNSNELNVIISQYSITFLVVTIVSVLSSKSDKQIYGVKMVEMLFYSNRRVNFNTVLFILFLAPTVNLLIYFYTSISAHIIPFFILSVTILSIYVFRMTNFLFTSKRLVNRVKHKYNKEMFDDLVKCSKEKYVSSNSYKKLVISTKELIKINNTKYLTNLDFQLELFANLIEYDKYMYQLYFTNSNSSSIAEEFFCQIDELSEMDMDSSLYNFIKILDLHNSYKLTCNSKYVNKTFDSIWSILNSYETYNQYHKVITKIDELTIKTLLLLTHVNKYRLNYFLDVSFVFHKFNCNIVYEYYNSFSSNKKITPNEKEKLENHFFEEFLPELISMKNTTSSTNNTYRNRHVDKYFDSGYNSIAIPLTRLLIGFIQDNLYENCNKVMSKIKDPQLISYISILLNSILIEKILNSCYLIDSDLVKWLNSSKCSLMNCVEGFDNNMISINNEFFFRNGFSDDEDHFSFHFLNDSSLKFRKRTLDLIEVAYWSIIELGNLEKIHSVKPQYLEIKKVFVELYHLDKKASFLVT